MKKYKLRAVAGTMALLMVLSSSGMGIAKAEDALLAGENVPVATEVPVADLFVQEADGETLVVTVEMADENGVIFIQGGEWEKIVISRDVEAKRIVLENVTAKELCVESGNRYVVEVKGGTIAKASVRTPELEVIDYDKIVALLKEGVPAGEVVEKYKAYQAEKELVAKTCPTLLTSEDAEIENVTVAGGAKLDLNAGKVGEIVVSSEKTTERIVVSIQNYDGKVTVDQKSNEDGTNNLLNIQLKNSKLAEFSVTGEEKSICYIEGDKNSNVAVVNVDGAPSITMNVDAEAVKVAETAEKSSVRIYSDVQNVEVKADNSKLSLVASAKVENAKVEGDNVKVSYSGTIANAEISGSGSSAEYVPAVTARPEPTATPNPTVAPTATPKPTVAPTETPKPTVFPIPTITPGGSTGTATGGALNAAEMFIYKEKADGTIRIDGLKEEIEAKYEAGTLTRLEIPAEIEGKAVTEIGIQAFMRVDATELIIPEGIKTIRHGAFAWMKKLESIHFPSTVESIGTDPLGIGWDGLLKNITVAEENKYYCAVDDVLFTKDMTVLIQAAYAKDDEVYTIPDTVKEIWEYAFQGCKIDEVVIPEGVETIGTSAFTQSDIDKIYIPASVTYMAEDAVHHTKLTSFEVDSENKFYSSEDGVWYDKDQTKLIMFAACDQMTEYIVPDTVTEICRVAFFLLPNLKRVTIPSTVTTMADWTFYYTTPVMVTTKGSVAEAHALANGMTVEYISEEAPTVTPTPTPEIEYTAEGFFEYEETDEGIVITYVHEWYYDEETNEGVELGEVLNIPPTIDGKQVVEITDALQNLSSVTEVNIPEGVLRIATGLPYNVERVAIPSSVTELLGEHGMFQFASSGYYNLKEITVASENEYYASMDNCLYNKDMTKLLLVPGGIKADSFEIPVTVTEVAGSAIQASIGTLVLTENVQEFDYSCYAASGVEEILVAEGNVFFKDYGDYIMRADESELIFARSGIEKFEIPKAMTSLNMTMFAWNGNVPLAFSIEEGNNSFCLEKGVLYDAKKTTLYHCTTEVEAQVLEVPETVIRISDYAFMESELEYVVLPWSLESIGFSAFRNSKYLQEIQMPGSCRSIFPNAFYGCPSLEELYIPYETMVMGMIIERNSPIVLITENEWIWRNAEYYGWTVVTP